MHFEITKDSTYTSQNPLACLHFKTGEPCREKQHQTIQENLFTNFSTL